MQPRVRGKASKNCPLLDSAARGSPGWGGPLARLFSGAGVGCSALGGGVAREAVETAETTLPLTCDQEREGRLAGRGFRIRGGNYLGVGET